MVTEIIETGKTVDEAISSACQKLGYDLESCEFEIIDFPKKSFLGLKTIPAKVRVYLKEEVIRAKEKAEKAVKKPEPKKPEPARQEKKQTKPQKPETSAQPKEKEKKPVVESKPEAKETQSPKEAPVKEEKAPFSEESITPEMREKAAAAAAYLQGVFKHLVSSEVTIQPTWEEGGVCLAVQGGNLGAIIGRRGETLDALQYLAGLVANRMEGDYLRITVDCGDYRVKRKATLEALAHRVAEQVLKTNTSKTLEPMNPFERRIIHATVSTIEGVTSTSVGEEPNRRVIITTPTAKSGRKGGKSASNRAEKPERKGKGKERSRRGGGKGVREQKPAAPQPAKEPITPPTEAADQPLYGKIDLE